MPRVIDGKSASGTTSEAIVVGSFDDLFGVGTGNSNFNDEEETAGDFAFPTFANTKSVWEDLCCKLGLNSSVISGGLGDTDEEPLTEAALSRTCPHLLSQVQYPSGTTWRAYGGGTSSSSTTSGVHQDSSLRNCFCNHHCSECPPPSDITAALQATTKKGRNSRGGGDGVSSSSATLSIPFHGHCLGCLGEFLLNKQYAQQDRPTKNNNAAAEFYPCLCLPQPPQQKQQGNPPPPSHLLQHYRYHKDQAMLAIDELDELDDDDDVDKEDEDESDSMMCVVTNTTQLSTREELEQLAYYHQQHCLYTFAMGSATTPVQVLYCAACDLFAPLCEFKELKSLFPRKKKKGAGEDETPAANKDGDNKKGEEEGGIRSWVANDTASTLMYKMLLVAHVALSISGNRNYDEDDDDAVSSAADVASSASHINDILMSVLKADHQRQDVPTASGAAASLAISAATELNNNNNDGKHQISFVDAAQRRLFLFKPCLVSPIQINDGCFKNKNGGIDEEVENINSKNTTEKDVNGDANRRLVKSALDMCHIWDQEICDDINETFFAKKVQETIYEAWGPMALSTKALNQCDGDGGENNKSASVVATFPSSDLRPQKEDVSVSFLSTLDDAVHVGVMTYNLLSETQQEVVPTSGDAAPSVTNDGGDSSPIGFVVEFESDEDVRNAIQIVNQKLLDRGLALWGYSSDAASSTKTAANDGNNEEAGGGGGDQLSLDQCQPSMLRYLEYLVASNGVSGSDVILNEFFLSSPSPSSVAPLPQSSTSFTIPIFQVEINTQKASTSSPPSTCVVFVPDTEASNHSDMRFLDVLGVGISNNTSSSPSMKVLPTQILNYVLKKVVVDVVSAASSRRSGGKLLPVTVIILDQEEVVGGGEETEESSTKGTPTSISYSSFQARRPSSSQEPQSTVVNNFVSHVEGLRFSAPPLLPSVTTCTAGGSNNYDDDPNPHHHSSSVCDEDNDDEEEAAGLMSMSPAARAIGQLAVAGGCPLSQPAANLQLLSTVATVARVITAIGEKFGFNPTAQHHQ